MAGNNGEHVFFFKPGESLGDGKFDFKPPGALLPLFKTTHHHTCVKSDSSDDALLFSPRVRNFVLSSNWTKVGSDVTPLDEGER